MISISQSPTPNKLKSEEFYLNLGFKIVSNDPLIVNDGKAYIEINTDRYARAGVKLFKNNWKSEISKLQENIAITTFSDGYLLADPSGVWIYLMEIPAPDFPVLEDKSFSILGNYAGLSLETTDIQRSIRFYETLGFKISSGSLEQGYVSLEREDFIISLMKPLSCPHLFYNPSLTYFNGKDNLAVIQKIRDLEILITEEITYFNKEGIVDNIIIRDPGGFGFFIFSD
ncbi:VOC family protein [Aquiflexum sp.]|uniref:VOC family protein n=1 Tax=Aquiflexum sp. TaxID=1872584 RepID=UPI00359479A4